MCYYSKVEFSFSVAFIDLHTWFGCVIMQRLYDEAIRIGGASFSQPRETHWAYSILPDYIFKPDNKEVGRSVVTCLCISAPIFFMQEWTENLFLMGQIKVSEDGTLYLKDSYGTMDCCIFLDDSDAFSGKLKYSCILLLKSKLCQQTLCPIIEFY